MMYDDDDDDANDTTLLVAKGSEDTAPGFSRSAVLDDHARLPLGVDVLLLVFLDPVVGVELLPGVALAIAVHAPLHEALHSLCHAVTSSQVAASTATPGLASCI